MINKVSMRSVAKKGSRLRTKISATMGFINQTRDLKFEDEDHKFHSIVKSCNALCEEGILILKDLETKHKSELGMIEAIAQAQIQGRDANIETIRNACRDVCNRLLPFFVRDSIFNFILLIYRLSRIGTPNKHKSTATFEDLESNVRSS